MSEDREQPDREQEKRTNTKLAVGVGVLGVGAFGAFYVLFFLVMIFKPGLIFSVMPAPSITTSALSDGSRTWLLFQKVDMSAISPREKRPPGIKHFVAALDGEALGAPQEVPAYASAVGADNRLVFLGEGGYRTYAGTKWTGVKTDGIGKDPRGTLSPSGLYVISRFEDGARLIRITDSGVTTIPLPKEFPDAEKKYPCSCNQLIWYQGQLCLFWTTDNSIAWTAWNGKAWAPVVASPFSGGFQAVADGQRLYFFHRQGEGPNRVLSYSVFANNAWTGPTRLPLPAGFTDWDAFLQQGKLMLFTQQITTQTLYTVENNTLANPVRLKGPFHPASMMGRMALVAVSANLAVFLAIFGVSALINRFKNRSWTQDGAQYEFATLFRRFIAYFIDNLLLLLPPAIAIALFFHAEDFPRNPFRFVLMVLLALVFFFLGGFLRNLLRIADAFFYYLVAAISLAGTFKWQRVGDMVAETVVVRQKKAEGG